MINISLTMNPDVYDVQYIWDVEFWINGRKVHSLGAWVVHAGWFCVEVRI